MENYFNKFYLDREKDIVITLYKNDKKLSYVLSTPYHSTGNLITNLSKITNLPLREDEDGLKIIKGEIPCFITSRNTEVYVLRLGNIKVANIYPDGRISPKATIPAVSKTLMAQTKDYNLSIEETLVKTYILSDYKFRSDLHTHMNGNLTPDVLIALGVYHQIDYPLYYVKKLKLKLNINQLNELEKQRVEVSKKLVDSKLSGKYLDRKIDDNTYINFADLILNNEYSTYNIVRIRNSLTILKDSQAVFTNLEKLYLYRYVFCKAVSKMNTINLNNIERIEDADIKDTLLRIIEDHKTEQYKNNNVLKDKLLWIARSLLSQGIYYIEISDTTLVKGNGVAFKFLKELHEILPLIKEETNVDIRFLAAIRRMPLTIVKDDFTPYSYLRENLDVLKVVAKDPYVAGSDIVGEENNDIEELEDVIRELVHYTSIDPSFMIRIHAGENSSLADNVEKAVNIVERSLLPYQEFPRLRLGHGLYTCNLNTKKGKELLNKLKKYNVTLEFQLSSNVRLNNLTDLKEHPLKKYLDKNINCVQGTDGQGLYGTNSIEEQLSLKNLLKLTDQDLLKMFKSEEKILNDNKHFYELKTKSFDDYLSGRDIVSIFEEDYQRQVKTPNNLKFKNINKLIASEVFEDKIQELDLNRTPIILAGGSFNRKNRKTKMCKDDKLIVDYLLTLDPKKYYFVIGNKLKAYEKYLVKQNKRFDIYAIVPSLVKEEDYKALDKEKVKICVSPETLRVAIYKSFNYEIFERIPSIIVALDGDGASENLIQEAKNGKAKAKILISNNSKSLKQKAISLKGYAELIDSASISKYFEK